MEAIKILRPAIVLGGWTVVMLFWMIFTRFPALAKAGIEPQQAQDTSRLRDLLPPEAQRVANNYNHLFEQPTLFYAIVLMIAILGDVDSLHVQCAWAFTILRIIHSCVQATVDIVMIRFSLFALSWLALGIMITREVMAVFQPASCEDVQSAEDPPPSDRRPAQTYSQYVEQAAGRRPRRFSTRGVLSDRSSRRLPAGCAP